MKSLESNISENPISDILKWMDFYTYPFRQYIQKPQPQIRVHSVIYDENLLYSLYVLFINHIFSSDEPQEDKRF